MYSVPFCVVICLLGVVSALAENCTCPCPPPPRRNLTKPPGTENCCPGNRFRYQCVDGYVRQAGTSNLVKCEDSKDGYKWSEPTLICIPNPMLKPTTTTPEHHQYPATTPEHHQYPATTPEHHQYPATAPEQPVKSGNAKEYEPPEVPPTASTSAAVTSVGAVGAVLIVVIALLFIGLWWRKRSQGQHLQTQATTEERLRMNPTGASQAADNHR